MREIKASGGYGSHDMPIARFGLGDWDRVASITVVWPGGERQVLRGLSLRGGRYTVTRSAE
jgi:hypothetical protein